MNVMTSDSDVKKLWTDARRTRFFLIPGELEPHPGSLCLSDLLGRQRSVSPESVTMFEITEDEARCWAKGQLGEALEDLKSGIDDKLADWRRWIDDLNNRPIKEGGTATPNAASAVFDFLTQLPRVVAQSISGDDNRVDSARNAIADLQLRLKESGVDLDDRIADFPDRLAGLRKDAELRRTARKSSTKEPPPDNV